MFLRDTTDLTSGSHFQLHLDEINGQRALFHDTQEIRVSVEEYTTDCAVLHDNDPVSIPIPDIDDIYSGVTIEPELESLTKEGLTSTAAPGGASNTFRPARATRANSNMETTPSSGRKISSCLCFYLFALTYTIMSIWPETI